MSRAVYVYRPGHPAANERGFVDVRDLGNWQEKTDEAKNYVCIDRHYWGVRTADGQHDIGSRTKHRQFLKDRGLTTADDFTDTWAKAAKERENYNKGIMPDARERRDEVGKIAYEVEQRARRRR